MMMSEFYQFSFMFFCGFIVGFGFSYMMVDYAMRCQRREFNRQLQEAKALGVIK